MFLKILPVLTNNISKGHYKKLGVLDSGDRVR
jgi:hypothetical protein